MGGELSKQYGFCETLHLHVCKREKTKLVLEVNWTNPKKRYVTGFMVEGVYNPETEKMEITKSHMPESF